MKLKFIDASSPIHRVREDVLAQLERAQRERLVDAFKTASDLCLAACRAAGVNAALSKALHGEQLDAFVDLAHKDIVARLLPAAGALGVSRSGTVKVADNIQLLRAFASPDAVIEKVRAKVDSIVDGFPRKASDLERGRNAGDVLDPFLLSATQFLLCDGDVEEAVKANVLHKCMMMVENLAGNLHQDVIGSMRGNVRAPEPRGEELDLRTNPFPGADIVQMPWAAGDPVRFFQVKSKTGSAKGGDGIRLGGQMQTLLDTYKGRGGGFEAWYSAIVGKTLDGHRSMSGARQGCSSIRVTVGEATLLYITRSRVGGELLLRVYQSAFRDVARARGYTARQVANAIAGEFRRRHGVGDDELLDGILRDVTSGPQEEQDSLYYKSGRARKAEAEVATPRATERRRT